MMAELHEIQAAMERAAELLATRPAEQWAGWVGYLLEALDEHAQAADFEDVLREFAELTSDEQDRDCRRRDATTTVV